MEFYEIDNMQIVSLASITAGDIGAIVNHTPNTWQGSRSPAEKAKDSQQGKKAEHALQAYLSANSDVVYLPYDDFRQDEGKIIAPFDALLYKPSQVSPAQIANIQQQVVTAVGGAQAAWGHIPLALKQQMNAQRVYTLEIKSSRLNRYERTGVLQSITKKRSDVARIVKNLYQKSDFLAYPLFCRSSDTIHSFEDYCSYVKENVRAFSSAAADEAAFKEKLIQTESDMAYNLYTRVYIDYENNRAMITGSKTAAARQKRKSHLLSGAYKRLQKF